MKADQSRADLLLGAAVVTIALVLSRVTGLEWYLFSPLLIVGVVLMAEGIWTNHTYQTATRMERTFAALKLAPKPATVTPLERDAVRLMRDWSVGAPTTRRYAQDKGIPQDRWQQIVALAASHGLGKLEQAQCGNPVLRWTATLDQALNVLESIA